MRSNQLRGMQAAGRKFGIGLVLIGLAASAGAQTPPRSFVAAPDVYKVVAGNAQFMIIEVTWQPGQRDLPHSHPVSGVYFLTDCSLRFFAPDGTSHNADLQAGHSVVQEVVPSHSVQNIGKSACRLVMFEPK